MADQQSQLLALPSRYTYSQQSDQVSKELSVELYFLPGCYFARSCACLWPPPRLGVRCQGGLLFPNSIAYTEYEGEEERYVDGARDARSVSKVQGREVIYYVFDRGF